MKMLAFAFAFVAGALVTLQIGSNARLRDAAGCGLMVVGFCLIWRF